MIFSERRRRMRSNGMHAETEEEFLEKLNKLDETQLISQEQLPTSPQLEGFIINNDFNFETTNSEPILLLEQIPVYKSHYIMLQSDDLNINPRRLLALLDSADNLTDSTIDDIGQVSQFTLKQDCYVHQITLGNIIHSFYIWIINQLQPLQIFKNLYYTKFEAYIIVVNKGCYQQTLLQDQWYQLKQLNQSIQLYIISDSDDHSFLIDKKFQAINLQSVLRQLIM